MTEEDARCFACQRIIFIVRERERAHIALAPEAIRTADTASPEKKKKRCAIHAGLIQLFGGKIETP
jgi:hypothetical protein